VRRLAFTFAVFAAMLLVGAVAGLGAQIGGRVAAAGLAAAAAALGWSLLSKAKARLFAARPADAAERLHVTAARVLYLIVAVAVVLAALR